MTEDADASDPSQQDERSLFASAGHGDLDSLAELRRRHRAALRSVVVGYVHDDTDPDVIVEAALDRIDSVPVPSSDGGVPLALFALVREAAGDHAVAAGGRRPLGLVDLATYGERPDLTGARRDQFLDAFDELGDRDQALLWFSAVEGASPADLEARLPIGSADTAATATHRARSHLRSALAKLRASEADAPDECRSYMVHLAALTDGTLTGSRAETVQRHTANCPNCQTLAAELSGVTGLLLGVAAPAVQAAATETPLSTSEAPLVAKTSGATLRPAPIVADPTHMTLGGRTLGRSRLAATVLAGAAVVVLIGLVVFGLTRNTTGSDSDELAVFVATTIGGPTTTYVSIYDGKPTSTVATSSSTTKPEASSKTKTTTTRRSGTPRPSRPAPQPGIAAPASPPEPTGPGPATSAPATTASTTTTTPRPEPGNWDLSFAPVPGAGDSVQLKVQNTDSALAPQSRLTLTVEGPGHLEPAGSGCAVDPEKPDTVTCSLAAVAPGATWVREFVDMSPATKVTAKVTSVSGAAPDSIVVWPAP